MLSAPVQTPRMTNRFAATWNGERLVCYTCRLEDLAERLPRFGRRPFGAEQLRPQTHVQQALFDVPGAVGNPYYDMIVRLPDDDVRAEVPIGIVSKRYRLVQHADLLDAIVRSLHAASVDWGSLRTNVRITEFGSRLHFTVHLPEQYRAHVEDDFLDLTLECLNSADRSWSFRVGMGWIRWICENGLFIGKVTASMRRPHNETLQMASVPDLVKIGLTAAKADAARWQARARLEVNVGAFDSWADSTLTKKWGALAAARAVLIFRTGWDGGFDASRESAPASRRGMAKAEAVPGSAPPNDNVFRVGQILAWLANSSSDWGTRLERRRDIPALLAPLVRSTGSTAC
jgi:hypothetical protein